MAEVAADRLAQRVIRRAAVACALAGAAVTVYARTIAPTDPGASRAEQAAYAIAGFVVLAALFLPVGAWHARRRLWEMLSWRRFSISATRDTRVRA